MEEDILLEIIEKLQTIGREWETVDAKQELVLKENGDKAEFVKDVVAMANNGKPSYLIIGLKDETFAATGELAHHHTTNKLNQILAERIDPPVIVDYQEFVIAGSEYAVVEINGQNPPYIVARDIVSNRNDRKRARTHRGIIYVRHGDRTEGIGRTELEGIYTKRGLRKEFENETAYAQMLALDRPDFWKFKLTAELIRSKLEPVRRKLTELERGLIYRQTIMMNREEYLSWISSRLADVRKLVNMIKIAVKEEINASWGEPGMVGDPIEIKHAVDRLIDACNEMFEWEANLHSIIPPNSFLRLKQLMTGWTSQIVDDVATFPGIIIQALEHPDPEGKNVINFVINAFPNVDEFMDETYRLQEKSTT